MVFLSLTRLKLRSIRFLPAFAIHTSRSLSQVKKAPGFLDGSLLPEKGWIFWTMTAWDSEESMRRFMTSGAHKKAMPRLLDWCDEASVAHWTQPDAALPTWKDAAERMRTTGRASKVRNPSPQHASLGFKSPSGSGGAPIRPQSKEE
jgi:hypothetical protein